jgi:hypothetical protein
MAADETRRPQEEKAEDQSTNEIGFRNVDEDADHDEAPGEQADSEGTSARESGR